MRLRANTTPLPPNAIKVTGSACGASAGPTGERGFQQRDTSAWGSVRSAEFTRRGQVRADSIRGDMGTLIVSGRREHPDMAGQERDYAGEATIRVPG